MSNSRENPCPHAVSVKCFPCGHALSLCLPSVGRWWCRVDAAQDSEVLKFMLCFTTLKQQYAWCLSGQLKSSAIKNLFPNVGLDLRETKSTQQFFACARDLADCFLRNIFLLSCCFLVNTDASFKEIYLCDGKREAQIISETLFSMWLKIEDTKFTAVSHPWRVKPQLDVIFQLMTGSGSISHKWDYLQCNSV